MINEKVIVGIWMVFLLSGCLENGPGGTQPPYTPPNAFVEHSTSQGSIQEIWFSLPVSAETANSNCKEFTRHHNKLGTDASCLISSDHRKLIINYGTGANANNGVSLSLKSNGFYPQVTGSFVIPNLPSFPLPTASPQAAYQDTDFECILGDINQNGLNNMTFEWSYITYPGPIGDLPDISGNINSFTFIRRQLPVGDYEIEVIMRDPDNSLYTFTETTSFEIITSCQWIDCRTIKWHFSSDTSPGCTEDCTSGHDPTKDTFAYESSPHYLKATYQPGSVGGNALRVEPSKNNGLNNVECGADIKFPVASIATNAPSCQPNDQNLVISASIEIGMDYNIEWSYTPEATFDPGTGLTCEIPFGALSHGVAYLFNMKLFLDCSHQLLWSATPFNTFTFDHDFSSSDYGSVQTITFMDIVSAVGAEGCGNLIEDTTYLGTDPLCSLPTSTTMRIGYGPTNENSVQTFSLRAEGFNECIKGTFSGISIPRVSLSSTPSQITAFQDHSVTFTATISNNKGAPMTYSWAYTKKPSTTNNLEGVTTNTVSFNYWEFPPGKYKFYVDIKETCNPAFRDREHIPEFEIKESCILACNKITWQFEANPETCTGPSCLNGMGATDSGILSYSGTSPPFLVTLTFSPGSEGQPQISLPSTSWGGHHNVPCTANLEFPYINIDIDPPPTFCQSSGEELVLYGPILKRGWHYGVSNDYSIQWEDPFGVCTLISEKQNCSISTGALAVRAESYIFKQQLFLNCYMTEPWDEVVFEFYYYPTFTTSTLHSVQTLLFSDGVSLSAGNTCVHIIHPDSIADLGTGSTCQLTDSTHLRIRYGLGLGATPVTIHLNSPGFIPCTEGNFTRPTLPTFTLVWDDLPNEAYQDHVAVLTGTENLLYEWSYLQFPTDAGSVKPDISASNTYMYTFHYSDMSPGVYEINLKMTDPGNDAYFMEAQSTVFEVLSSCTSDCDQISWIFSNDPGICASDCSDCFTGLLAIDDCTKSIGTGPFTVNLTYLPGSMGGYDLAMAPTNWSEHRNNFNCGSQIKFPNIILENDAPGSCIDLADISLSVTVDSNELTQDIHYSLTWLTPVVDHCLSGDSSCTTLKEDFSGHGPFEFKVQLKVSCQSTSDVWKEVTFTEFNFWLSFTPTTLGAIQTITFIDPVTPIAGYEDCTSIIENAYQLGTAANCQFSATELIIKYGYSLMAGEVTIILKSDGFHTCVGGTFLRALLPSFTVEVTSGILEAYKDNSLILEVNPIVNIGNVALLYFWYNCTGITDGNCPTLSVDPSTSYTFNYWEMPMNQHLIRVFVKDPANDIFFNTQDVVLVVKNSCATDCQHISWRFSNDPGNCAADCFSSVGAGNTYTYEKVDVDTAQYEIRLEYEVGSVGGINILPNSSNWDNHLNTTWCGENAKFPSIVIENDAPLCPDNNDSLTLSVTVDPNEGESYTLIWVTPTPHPICTEQLPECTIPANSLSRSTIYQFKLQLKLDCESQIWSEVVFSELQYGMAFTVETIGANQILYFTGIIGASVGAGCSDLLMDVTHLGINPQCFLTSTNPTNMKIKYGYDAVPGTHILHLKSASFTPCAGGSFERAILPSFTLSTNNPESGYQDVSATISVTPITNSVTLSYAWSYVGQIGTNQPNLAGSPTSTTSVTFNYWEMAPGNYQVRVNLTAPDNTVFYYKVDSPQFEVINSCLTHCHNITWFFTTDPGSVRGGDNGISEPMAGTESFVPLTVTTGSAYSVSLVYNIDSKGGRNLTLHSGEWTGSFHNVPCGETAKFPSIIISQDAQECESLVSPITLGGDITSQSLIIDKDYNYTWDTDGVDNICPNTSTSCTIPSGTLVVGRTYQFKIQISLLCQSTYDIWDEIHFTPFSCSPTFTYILFGSVSTLTFSNQISEALTDSCVDYFIDISQIGTSAACNLSNEYTLIIKYGDDATLTPITLNLNPAGFTTCVLGSFVRGSLPKFSLLSSNADPPMYADNSANFTITSIVNVGAAPLEYIWSYITSPGDTKPPLGSISSTTYIFNYWEADPGFYNISVKMVDPENSAYFYEEFKSFEILISWEVTCNELKWFFTNDPGSCVVGVGNQCIQGSNAEDTFTLDVTAGTSPPFPPFTLTLTYEAGSTGSESLSLNSTPFSNPSFNHIGSRSSVYFPSIEVLTNPPSCNSPKTPLTLSGSVTPRGRALDTDFTITWVQGGDEYVGTEIYVIPVYGLPTGGPYLFRAQIILSCLPGVVWSEAQFSEFEVSPTFTEYTVGAVQLLTFSDPVVALVGETCGELLMETTHLGVGAICSLHTPTTLQIQYGPVGDPVPQTIELRSEGFTACTAGTFPRPALPVLTLTQTLGINPGFQDNIVRIECVPTTLGSPFLTYEWSYLATPPSPLRPDISIGASFDFNFWEMARGEYNISVKLRESANPAFYYEATKILTVDLTSCTAECDTITWKFTGNPGICSSMCAIGYDQMDSLIYSLSTISSVYFVSAQYNPGSPGGHDLSLISSKYNGLHSGSCGADLKFPTFLISSNSQQCQTVEKDFVLSVTFINQGLILGTDYTLTWIEPSGFNICPNGSPLCVIPAGSLSVGESYIFQLQLLMICSGGTEKLWMIGDFRSFQYLTTVQCQILCPFNTYYDLNDTFECLDCDFRCKGCTGRTNTHCLQCANNPTVNREKKDGDCVCEDGFIYAYNNNIKIFTCEKCHTHCHICTGSSELDCTICANPRIYDPDTGSCKCPPTMYEIDNRCVGCSVECATCEGPGKENCLSCNTPGGYYPQNTNLTNCLFLCQASIPLFLINNECHLCHPNCQVCFGFENTECSQCIQPYLLGDKRECIYKNCSHYLNTFATIGDGGLFCENCLDACDGCRGAPNYCLDCKYGLYMHAQTHSCLTLCPPKYYSYQDIHTCQKCPNHCMECERVNFNNPKNESSENFICKFCDEEYFLNSEQVCVPKEECGIEYYPEISTHTCDLCSQACLGCSCSDNTCCLHCQEKYFLTQSGSCETTGCLPNEYLDANLTCRECHKYCEGCIGPYVTNCRACQSGFTPQFVDGFEVFCIRCEDIKGYYTTENNLTKSKECKEICGDGLNLGEYQCDDGNQIDGDGCSSKCTYEEGFKCIGGNEKNSDICKDIVPPVAVVGGNGNSDANYLTFTFIFSKPVQIMSNEKPKTFIILNIIGEYEAYSFDFEIEFYKYEIITAASENNSSRLLQIETETIDFYKSIVINLIPTSSLAENDKLNIYFKPGILADINGNLLMAATHKMPLPKTQYFDPSTKYINDKEVVDSSGNAVLYSMLGLLTLNLIIAIVCSSSMSLLFPLFNMIQLITLSPLLQLNLPENIRSFISEYLQFANLKFDFLFNPFHNWKLLDLSEVINNPFNDNFAANDLKSRSLLVNYGTQIMIWSFVAFLYIPISIFAKCCKCKKMLELKSAYEYGVLFTSFSEAFVEFTLLSFLNLFQLEFSSYATTMASLLGIFGVILASGYMVTMLNIISNIGHDLENKDNLRKFGALYQDTNYKTCEQKIIPPQFLIMIFLMRRFLYILSILLLYKFPILQQTVNISIHCLVLIYDIFQRPYPICVLGIMSYFFDLVLAIFFSSLPIYMILDDPSESEFMGRVHIYILIATIALSWMIILGMSIRTIYLKFKKPTMKEQLEEIISNLNKNTKDDGDSPLTKIKVKEASTSGLPKRKPVLWVKKSNMPTIKKSVTNNIDNKPRIIIKIRKNTDNK